MTDRRIGIAGYMGCGKTLFADHLCRRIGGQVLCADTIAKELMNRDSRIQEQLAAQFGIEAIKEGCVDSRLLGERVFDDISHLWALNAIVHPPLLSLLHSMMDSPLNTPHILDAALIPYWNDEAYFDRLFWIDAPSAVRQERLCARTGRSAADLAARIALQEKLFAPPASAHWTHLDNSGTMDHFVQTIEQCSKEILCA